MGRPSSAALADCAVAGLSNCISAWKPIPLSKVAIFCTKPNVENNDCKMSTVIVLAWGREKRERDLRLQHCKQMPGQGAASRIRECSVPLSCPS